MALDILLVEDNPHKQSRILEFLNGVEQELKIDTAASFTSGCQKIEINQYLLIILDVSLPTYDRSATDSGGKFRILGGREIARKLVRLGVRSKIVFLTQYTSFSDKGTSHTFESLSEQLKQDCGALFSEMVFFDATSSKWKEVLQQVIVNLKNENNSL
jgi:CheY-like chemotaxis protein